MRTFLDRETVDIAGDINCRLRQSVGFQFKERDSLRKLEAASIRRYNLYKLKM
jgi:hypothetical protein